MLSNLRIVVTGGVPGCPKKVLKEILKAFGSELDQEVTKKTDLLVVGEFNIKGQVSSNNLRRAIRYGIKVIGHEEFKRELERTAQVKTERRCS